MPQQAVDTKESGDVTFRTGVKSVLVPVVVRASGGRPVGGLKAEDFQLFDRGKRQTISSFTAAAHVAPALENQLAGRSHASAASDAGLRL